MNFYKKLLLFFVLILFQSTSQNIFCMDKSDSGIQKSIVFMLVGISNEGKTKFLDFIKEKIKEESKLYMELYAFEQDQVSNKVSEAYSELKNHANSGTSIIFDASVLNMAVYNDAIKSMFPGHKIFIISAKNNTMYDIVFLDGTINQENLNQESLLAFIKGKLGLDSKKDEKKN